MYDEDLPGAAKSLHKTISELIEHLEHEGTRPNRDLRLFMYEKIADLTEEWLEYGFYLGHRQSYRALRDDGEIPATLEYEEGSWEVAPGQFRRIDVSSRIRRT